MQTNMQTKKASVGSSLALTTFAFTLTLLMASTLAAAQTETVLYNFTGCGAGCDGPASVPPGGVIFDSAGNLYGPTVYGGTTGDGTIFEVSPGTGGSWNGSVLYNFVNNKGSIAYGPDSALVIDAAGNLYGTRPGEGSKGLGLVFELSPVTGGGWTWKGIHSFNDTNGANPEGSLLMDGAGNLYGTTESGGQYGYGTVFELTPVTGGWEEKLLHSFKRGCCDGALPTFTSLVMDASGNLYGTTTNGGGQISKACPYGCGVVFELTPVTGGRWQEKLLHSFAANGTDGILPSSGVTLNGGNIFGTTFKGGTGACQGDGVPGCGTVFELSPASGGGWTESIVHSFLDNATDGGFPQDGDTLIFDSAGNFYGVTPFGGPYSSSYGGMVFKFSPAAGGDWTESILHFFDDNGTDGFTPAGPLVFDAAGNLYGTTESGGTGGSSAGTVFKITP